MAEYTCEQFLHFKIDEERTLGSLTTRDEPSSSSPDLNINLNFSCKPCIFQYVPGEDSEEPWLLRHFFLPTIRKHIRINQVQFLSKESACEIIDEDIKHWGTPVTADNRRILANFALEEAWKAAKSMPASHNTVHLNIRVMSVHKHYYDDIMRSALRQSMEEDRASLVPAADSSIEALERRKVILILEGSETCRICLEEFSEGCEGICMPCSHVFHGDCIKEWLRRSHYCPLCRFEMPTTC